MSLACGSTSSGGGAGSPGTLVVASGGSTVTSGGDASDATSGSANSSAGSSTPGSGGLSGSGGASGSAGSSGQEPMMVDAGAPTPVGDQSQPRKLTIENHCTYEIWNFALPESTFPGNVPYKLASGDAIVVGWPNNWSGRIWPRSECTGDPGKLKCAQTGNDTLAEFTLTAGMNSDWYDISLVDGFTIPTGIIQIDAPWTASPSYVPGGPLGADQQCGSPICAIDLNLMCPDSQQMKDSAGKVVGCKNGQSSNGGHGSTPVTEYMKKGCPTSYTYPYDDPQSLFICPDAAQNAGKGAKDYKIVYCPAQGATPGFP
ncbi:MAG TPA: thaumatin family protein [Polyangiaceae bacterium]